MALVADGGKKIYLILSEGSVNEQSYLAGIRSRFKNAQLMCCGSSKASAPLKLLKLAFPGFVSDACRATKVRGRPFATLRASISATPTFHAALSSCH